MILSLLVKRLATEGQQEGSSKRARRPGLSGATAQLYCGAVPESRCRTLHIPSHTKSSISQVSCGLGS